jgi:hypothetical protein
MPLNSILGYSFLSLLFLLFVFGVWFLVQRHYHKEDPLGPENIGDDYE